MAFFRSGAVPAALACARAMERVGRIGYARLMTEFSQLCAIAYHGERVASRRLALREGISEAAALLATLERAAGTGGLSTLIGHRTAAQAAAVHRALARTAQKNIALAAKMARHDGPPTRWRAWFDGSAHPNPGACGIGAVLTGPAGERLEISRAAGYGNSSEAEYLALIAVLEAALDAGADELTVYGDSQGVIDDAGAGPEGGAQSLRKLRSQAQHLMAKIAQVTLRWVPRHKNAAADALSQSACAGMAEASDPVAPLPRRPV